MKTERGGFRMRRIAEALHDAYKGELEYRYNKAQNLLRVAWRR